MMQDRFVRVLYLLALLITVSACVRGPLVPSSPGPPVIAPKLPPSPAPPTGPRELKGHEKPYIVNGKRYDPLKTYHGFVQEGVASWYGPQFHGKRTSNGEVYDMYAMTAAHKTLPLGVYVKIVNIANGLECTVRINDRGPFAKGRIIDLSKAAAERLKIVGPGTAPVRIEALGYREGGSGGGEVHYRQPESYQIGSYAVQVGAFSQSVNARRLAQKLEAEVGAASVSEGMINGRLFFRVWAGNYPTLEGAESARKNFEAAGYRNCIVIALE